MPIYEYQCAECNKVFEVFQKINDNPIAECKYCKGKVEQIISHTSFQLKGGGWYVTDYAKKSASSKTEAPKSESPKSDSAEKPSESKSESKSSEKSSGKNE